MRGKAAGIAAATALLATVSCSSSDGEHLSHGQHDAGLTSGSTELDVAAENTKPGTTAWRIPTGQGGSATDVGGFARPSTVLSGQQFKIFVSTGKRSLHAAAYRMGYYGGTGAHLYWRSGGLAARRQTNHTYLASTRTVVENWTATATIGTSGWPPGVYLIKLIAGSGSATRSRFLPIVVRSKTTAGRTVLMPSLFTSNAYNDFGGRSAYYGPNGFADRALAVSFDRPNSWKTYGSGAGKFLGYERPVIRLAEKAGLPLAYESDLDISTVPDVLYRARALVTLGHAEYWSVPERNAVATARGHGTNLIFLGANTSYWRVRLTARNRVMVIYKSTADPVYPAADTTTLWRAAPKARPEWRLTGDKYNCFPATSGALRVVAPGFWAFAGTGATSGSRYDDLVGPEVDEAINSADVPRPLQVVASSPASCGGRSSMIYYTVASGAGVVATGTMGWVIHGLSSAPSTTRAFVKRVTTTLLREAGRGPLGKLHPAKDNLRSYS